MTKKDELKLTEGSHYRILSIGGRESPIETEGIFRGYATLGIEEGGLLIELSDKHKNLTGKLRILPLQAILSVDILDAKEMDKKEDAKETNHYYG